jgi:4-amino-4-deoxy-L-arabinose transferase-like glycosyltransferase
MINLVWLLTGVSEFAARLVGPACAVAMIGGTAVLARRLWPDQDLGVRAALILLGFAVFLIYGSATMFDALLGLGVLGGVAALWRIGQGGGLRAWAGFGLALAFGVYAKGPVIFVHLMPLVLALPFWAPVKPKLSAVLQGFGLALLVALGLVALWLVPTLITATPEFRTELLWTQSAARVAGGMAHDRPIWFLLALVPLILFPWGWNWGAWRAAFSLRADPAMRLCAIWAAATLILFSLISGKQAHYLLPAFPAMALIFARAGQQRRSFAALPLLAIAGLLVVLGPGLIPPGGDITLQPAIWPIMAFAGLCGVLGLALWRLPLLPGHLLAGVGLALGMHAVIAATGLYAAYDGRRLADKLAPYAEDGLAVVNAEYHAEINFLARLTAPVAHLTEAAALREWAMAHPKGMIFGRVKENPLTAGPQEVLHYMGQDWGLWPAASISRE